MAQYESAWRLSKQELCGFIFSEEFPREGVIKFCMYPSLSRRMQGCMSVCLCAMIAVWLLQGTTKGVT